MGHGGARELPSEDQSGKTRYSRDNLIFQVDKQVIHWLWLKNDDFSTGVVLIWSFDGIFLDPNYRGNRSEMRSEPIIFMYD